MKSQLSNSLIESIGIISDGNIYSVRDNAFNLRLIDSIGKAIVQYKMRSVLMDVEGRLVYAHRTNDLIILIVAKRAASLSFLRSVSQNVVGSIDIRMIKEQVLEEGHPIVRDDSKLLIKRYKIPEGELILKSHINYMHPEEVLRMTEETSGYILVRSKEGDGLVIFNDGAVSASFFEGECDLDGDEALDQIYSLHEGEIECYRLDIDSSSENGDSGLSLLGLDDGAMEVICEAKRLREELNSFRINEER